LCFNFFFRLGGEDYIINSGAIISGILDMRMGKQSLHFLLDDELIPLAVVNIPNNEKMHFGVFYFIYLFIFYYLFCLYLFCI
jgi:hypothetical protein